MTNHKIDEELTAADAEKHLQTALGEPDGYWRVYLQNNRRPERKPAHVILFAVVRGRPRYKRSDLDEHIEIIRQDQLRRGKVPGRLQDVMTAVGSTPTGRPFTPHITPQVEEGQGLCFVRIQLPDPLLLFRLEPEQARVVAAELVAAAEFIDRATQGVQ